ncbi:feruloyl esterase B [Xylariaceae sp. AK1471]|nr:feruloyl esterase B [Xylariaceae sp. AK1471]
MNPPSYRFEFRGVTDSFLQFTAGFFDMALVPAVATGYAAGSTDAGVNLEGDPRDWANSPQLVENFLHLSYHEMTVLGKELSEKFYGKKPRYSYWNGCSTGGRQGMTEVQMYPKDYDGVFAGAPGINWAKLIMGMYWPIVLQRQSPESLGQCQLSFIGNASIEACDSLDGATDGLIGNPLECKFNAASLVGTKVDCDGTTKITERDASVWNGIFRTGLTDKYGKRLWYGLQPGADAGILSIQPGFIIPKLWIADFVLADPDYNLTKIGQDELVDLFYKSVSVFGPLWSTDDPDLSSFQTSGGKLLTWHGWADQLIPPESTLEYWHRVVDTLGGQEKVDEFYRVFMAPGVGHCYGGPGPQPPTDPVAPLVEWVENGNAPDTVTFSGNGQARNICKYPARLKYKGAGDVSEAASWECV